MMTLRSHHVLGYLDYLRYLQDPQREKDYLKHWRNVKGEFHSDHLVQQWEATLQKLHQNSKFQYVPERDSVCEECEHVEKCHDPNHEYYRIVKEADDNAQKQLPELEFGKVYDGNFLRELFRKKDWLE